MTHQVPATQDSHLYVQDGKELRHKAAPSSEEIVLVSWVKSFDLGSFRATIILPQYIKQRLTKQNKLKEQNKQNKQNKQTKQNKTKVQNKSTWYISKDVDSPEYIHIYIHV